MSSRSFEGEDELASRSLGGALLFEGRLFAAPLSPGRWALDVPESEIPKEAESHWEVTVRTLLGGEVRFERLEPLDGSNRMIRVVVTARVHDPEMRGSYILTLSIAGRRRAFVFSLPGENVQERPLATSSDFDESVSIDYMARDYASLRRILIDHVSARVPEWSGSNLADPGVLLIELLAGDADYLSFLQDAVADESSLESARLRGSIERHAALLDYRVSNGCNARAFVSLEVNRPVELEQGEGFYLPVDQRPAQEADGDREAPHGEFFESMFPFVGDPQANLLRIVAPELQSFSLSAGTQCATIHGAHPFPAGTFLGFERIEGPGGSSILCSQVVRLNRSAKVTFDARSGPVTELSWSYEDALRVEFPVQRIGPFGDTVSDRTIVRGNVLLVDQGRTVLDSNVERISPSRIRILDGESMKVAWAEDFRWLKSSWSSASALLAQDARHARPLLSVLEHHGADSLEELHPSNPVGAVREWPALAVADLVGSKGRHVVLDRDWDGSGLALFSVDGLPSAVDSDTQLVVRYRAASGEVGSLGLGTVLTPTVWTEEVESVVVIEVGPSCEEAEPSELIPLRARSAARGAVRCVTPSDYEVLLRMREDVGQVSAMRRADDLRCIDIVIEGVGGQDLSDAQVSELQAYLDDFRLIGHVTALHSVTWLPLFIGISVTAIRDSSTIEIERCIKTALYGGSDNMAPLSLGVLSIGRSITLAEVRSSLVGVEGVASVEFFAFCVVPGSHESAGKTLRVDSIISILPSERLTADPARGSVFELDFEARLTRSGGDE